MSVNGAFASVMLQTHHKLDLPDKIIFTLQSTEALWLDTAVLHLTNYVTANQLDVSVINKVHPIKEDSVINTTHQVQRNVYNCKTLAASTKKCVSTRHRLKPFTKKKRLLLLKVPMMEHYKKTS